MLLNQRYHAFVAHVAQLPAEIRYGTAIFFAMRLFWWLWGALVSGLVRVSLPMQTWMMPAAARLTGLAGGLLEPWNRWDVLWYMRIALEGYGPHDGRGAFAPLLPLLIRGISLLMGGAPLAAAALVSNLACWGSLVLLFRAAEDLGVDGRRALLALVSYPLAFFLFVPYADGLLLCCALAAWLAARSGRWPLAGLLGALAVLTKVTGLLLVIPLAWQAVTAWRAARERGGQVWWPALSLLLLPAAELAWVLQRTIWHGQGTALTLAGVLTHLVSPDFRIGWESTQFAWPWAALASAVAAPVREWPRFEAAIAAVDLVLIAWVILALVGTWRLRHPGLAWFSLAVVVANLMFVVTDTPLIDVPRRCLLAFPLFLAFAALPPRWMRLWLLVAWPLQLILSVLFLNWLMVG